MQISQVLLVGGAVLLTSGVLFAARWFRARPAPAGQVSAPVPAPAPDHDSTPSLAPTALPPLKQAWSITDDEEDTIPTALFRPADDPEFAAFLAEERSVEGRDPRRVD